MRVRCLKFLFVKCFTDFFSVQNLLSSSSQENEASTGKTNFQKFNNISFEKFWSLLRECVYLKSHRKKSKHWHLNLNKSYKTK